MEFPKFLRIATIENAQSVPINETLSLRKPTYKTSNQALIDILSEVLDFTYTLVRPTDGAFGSILPDGNWSGMVGLVHQQKVDMAISYLSITEERHQAVDFSFPYYIDRVVFATNKLQRSISATSFLKPFAPGVWIGLALSILCLQITYYILYQWNLSLRFLCAGEMFKDQSMRYPGNASKSFLKMCWFIAKTLLTWSYVAVLLSFLTLPSLSGIRTIAELGDAVEEGKYQCITNPGSYVPDALILCGGSLKVIGENLKKISGSNDVQKTLQETKSSKKLAFVASETNLLTYKSEFFISDDGMFPDMNAIAIRKDFCCKVWFDLTIQRIWASSIFYHVLEDQQFRRTYKVQQESVSDNVNHVKALGLSDFMGLFVLLAIGHVLAIVVFLLEFLIGRKRNKI